MHFAIDCDRFGFYLAANVSVFTNRQDAVGIDFPFDLPVDEKLLLELDRAFDFDIAREDVFATVICHRFWFIDDCCCYYWFFAIRRMIVVIFHIRIPRSFCNRRHRLLRDESFEHPVDCGSTQGMSTNSRFSTQFLFCNGAVQFAGPILRSQNQKRRYLAWGPIQHAAQRERRRCLTQNCCRVLLHTFGIVCKNPLRLVIPQNSARFLPIVAKEKSCAVLDAVQTLVRASSYPGLPGPM